MSKSCSNTHSQTRPRRRSSSSSTAWTRRLCVRCTTSGKSQSRSHTLQLQREQPSREGELQHEGKRVASYGRETFPKKEESGFGLPCVGCDVRSTSQRKFTARCGARYPGGWQIRPDPESPELTTPLWKPTTATCVSVSSNE